MWYYWRPQSTPSPGAPLSESATDSYHNWSSHQFVGHCILWLQRLLQRQGPLINAGCCDCNDWLRTKQDWWNCERIFIWKGTCENKTPALAKTPRIIAPAWSNNVVCFFLFFKVQLKSIQYFIFLLVLFTRISSRSFLITFKAIDFTSRFIFKYFIQLRAVQNVEHKFWKAWTSQETQVTEFNR